ncbi:uncharacterized protein [Nicotiana tomentosiformis]|uniref:uncharacterized protein n=1 Tax=Nicotiana tomentosiformis TaxID=4098 RepID=UPI00388C4DD3
MKINTDRIRPSNVRIRAFKGSARDTIGEFNLTMTIGTVDFEIVFQVVDMETPYNFLLKSPWIHVARAVSSTLHHMLKFEHDRQEIIVHGEDESSIYKDPLIPCIEAKEVCESIVYQAFEVVVVDHVEEGKPNQHPRLSATSIMVAALMLRRGLRPRQTYEDRSKHRKRHGWVLQKSIPHIFYTFVKTRLQEGQNSSAHENIDEICHVYNKMFSEVNMIQAGEGTSHADMQLIGLDTMLNNWEATPLHTRKESWVLPFGLKNAGETYMRSMTTIFHDMMHKEIKVYVDDVIIKSKTQADHVRDLKKIFKRLRRYDLKLNPFKCAFGVPFGKLLDFIVSRRGIELDPSKIKSIRDLPPLKNKTEVMSLLERLNYISRFIAQLTTMCEPIFKLLKKDVVIKWMDYC